MKGMIEVGAIALALLISGVAVAQAPEEAQKMQAAKTQTKMMTEQELHKSLMQNQAEQQQLHTALKQKQQEQQQIMQHIEKVKAAK